MTSLLCHQMLKLNKPPRALVSKLMELGESGFQMKVPWRSISTDEGVRFGNNKVDANESSDLVVVKPGEIFQKEFPDYFHEGKFINRISYVDYVHQALDKLKDLGLERDLEAYKELFRVFPEGKYHRQGWYDLGLHHAPQQIAGLRILTQMGRNLVKPDKELEVLVIRAFGKSSDVWNSVARNIYWSMKGRNTDIYPVPEKVPEKTYDIAKTALIRMLDDPKSVITVTSTASIPDAIDRTWIVYSQSPIQKAIIERLDKKNILYIEETGLTYIKDKYLTYFTLKLYDDEETIKRREESKKVEPDFNYNTLKMQFFGKPIIKKMEQMDDVHHVDDCHILAIGLSGTSSQDSVLSWLKLLQRRNPNLKNLNVVFRFKRSTQDLVTVDEKVVSAKQQ